MWERAILKSKAKDVLKGCYWRSFLVSLILVFFSKANSLNFRTSDEFSNELNVLLFIIFISIFFISVILRIFLGYNLEVGGRKFFVRSAKDDTNLSYLGYAFKNGNYFKVIGTMIYRDILLILWTLLLIIPGIIKNYAYLMVPYILADNPKIGYKRAIQLSNEMTKGHKFRIFVLQLSFIGWYLLGLIALIVGVFFVRPYVDATEAQLYLHLRQEAIDKGLTTYEELNLQPSTTN